MSRDANANMTEQEARTLLTNINHQALNAFRKTMPTRPFSSLIAWVANPQPIVAMLEDKNIGDDELAMACAAAMLAISDELGRRMPVSRR